MPSPNASLSSRARSLSHGVAAIMAGGFGAGGAAGFGGGAAGFGGAAFGGSAARFGGSPTASLPGGGASSEPPGFCSSAISVPCEDSYTYRLRGRVSNCAAAAKQRGRRSVWKCSNSTSVHRELPLLARGPTRYEHEHWR